MDIDIEIKFKDNSEISLSYDQFEELKDLFCKDIGRYNIPYLIQQEDVGSRYYGPCTNSNEYIRGKI